MPFFGAAAGAAAPFSIFCHYKWLQEYLLTGPNTCTEEALAGQQEAAASIYSD